MSYYGDFEDSDPDFWAPRPRKAPAQRTEKVVTEHRRTHCPHCGTEHGMAFGTGDCGCGNYNDSDSWN